MIDYHLVSKAINFYETLGYNYIEAPWIVKPEALNVTLPSHKYGICAWHPTMDLGYLVGSAEQAFIQMMIEGKLQDGKYCAAGPCFRDDEEDELHFVTFFKVELINVGSNSKKDLDDMIYEARCFMSRGNSTLEYTEDGIDLMINGIEVGSYGCREYKDYKWIYGTGLALPRFNKACRNEK